jgi:hypothetical protein
MTPPPFDSFHCRHSLPLEEAENLHVWAVFHEDGRVAELRLSGRRRLEAKAVPTQNGNAEASRLQTMDVSTDFEVKAGEGFVLGFQDAGVFSDLFTRIELRVFLPSRGEDGMVRHDRLPWFHLAHPLGAPAGQGVIISETPEGRSLWPSAALTLRSRRYASSYGTPFFGALSTLERQSGAVGRIALFEVAVSEREDGSDRYLIRSAADIDVAALAQEVREGLLGADAWLALRRNDFRSACEIRRIEAYEEIMVTSKG